MVKKILGYMLIAVGLIILLVNTFPTAGDKFLGNETNSSTATLTKSTQGTAGLVMGLIIVGVGIIFSLSGRNERVLKEIPIFDGRKVVGYRRR